ncbi:M20/M25/M40 family metallo-hydrolase [Planococcus dechangensis]|uniref:M20/M25/M40 family metallo-hydrolase n=1 Tax=Planococcus dechangensis TaxID=1176255 RepID=A0ABV9MBV4_9BACL
METLWGTPERLRELTELLVGWDSQGLTEGEVTFPDKLKNKLLELGYFQQNPEYLALGEVNWERRYLTALYKHEKASRTVVLLSHFDTVAVHEYGDLAPLAYQPAQLEQAFQKIKDEFKPDVQKDLASGEYIFGRGIMDMKSGLAIHMALIERASLEQWPVNLLLMSVPDEEVNSAGMRYGVSKLLDLERQHGLNYTLFLNGEPVFAKSPGDLSHYIYTGSIGKIMPSALFFGKETHAGEPLAGMTSSYISTYLTRKMEWNPAFSETVFGEESPFPVTLTQGDMKAEYSVQTPYRTKAMYNVFTMERSAQQVMDIFESLANESAMECINDYHAFCKRIGMEPHFDEIRVLRFEQLMDYAKEKFGIDYINELIHDTMMSPERDVRDKSFHIADLLLLNCQELSPSIVLLFAPPYYPAVNSSTDPLIEECVAYVTQQARERFELELEQVHFFNGISDLSYVNYDVNSQGWISYEKNTPVYGDPYSIPFQAMQQLQAPVLNIGPFGKDPHKRTERLHIKNAFEEIPELLAGLILHIGERED